MKIQAFKHPGHPVIIETSRVQRKWMDETVDGHAYKCFPVALANQIGWTISYTIDVEFIWDGISDSSPNHVTILKGKEVSDTNRGNGTISFWSGIEFKTDEDISMLSIAPPNNFIDGVVPFTNLISTSFLKESYPIAWKITRPNVNILIPAGTPICTLIPISLGKLSEIELDLYDYKNDPEYDKWRIERNKAWQEIANQKGGFTNFYRDAVDHNGNSVGKHEVKSIRMKVNDFTKSK